MNFPLAAILDQRPAPAYLTTKQVADLLGVSIVTLCKWRRSPKRAALLAWERASPGRFVYPTSKVVEFIRTYKPRNYPRRTP